MLLKIFIWLFLTAVGSFVGQHIMDFYLRRNEALLREYDLQIGRVCHIATLAAGVAVALALGYLVPATLVGKALSCFFLYWLWLLWLVDWRYQFIFDDSLLPLLAGGIAIALYAPGALWLRLVAAGGTFVVLAALSILGRGALGGGDVKMMAVVGLWLGKEVILALTTGFILGGVAAVVLLLLRRAGRKDFFAFGPFLIIGTLLGWLLQAVAW